jgi:hypothetical protein
MSTLRQEQQYLFNKIGNLQHPRYHQAFIHSVIHSNSSSQLDKEGKPLNSVYITFVKGISENLKHVGNH